jgi:Zn-dependent peptidase ImmA (M78 family)
MSKVAVKKNVLQWALDRSNRSVQDLEQRFPKIGDWMAGQSAPTLRQLEKLAKATLTPLGMLFLDKPPDERLPIPYFRTNRNDDVERPSPDLLETIQNMERRQAWMREFVIEEGQEPLPCVGCARVDEEPTAVAQKICATLGFAEAWASHERTWTDALDLLREVIDRSGIAVVANGVVGNNTHRKLDPAEFRGFVLVDEYVPLVFINASDGKAAQMFTLAHEIAHVFFGSSAAFDLRQMRPAQNTTERACDQVAAEFLVPQSLLRQAWPDVKDDDEPFQRLAQRFKVSAIVAARRALDLQMISTQSFREFYQTYLADARRKKQGSTGGGNFYATQNMRVGMRFGTTVVRAVREGKLLYSEAYSLTGLHGATFDKFAASLVERGSGL